MMRYDGSRDRRRFFSCSRQARCVAQLDLRDADRTAIRIHFRYVRSDRQRRRRAERASTSRRLRKTKLPAWHWAWMSNGGEDGGTIRANREGFEHYQIRARRLVDVSKIDTSVTLFGKTWETPIFLCPVSGHRMYNPQGELATARAAKAKKHLQMLSTMTTTPVEEVNAARGEPVWFQLYTRPEWSQTRELVKRVEAAGCPALVFTVDLLGGRNTELFIARAAAQSAAVRRVPQGQSADRCRPIGRW